MKVLVIGPSDTRSRGGMATVIREMRDSDILTQKNKLNFFESFIDGNLIVRLAFSIKAYIQFLQCYKKYDLFHIHVASYGSTFRKNFYLKRIKKAGKKAILHIHGAEYMLFYENLSENRKKIVQNFLQNADMVIALSEDWKKKFDRTFQLINCVVLENGIDMKRLQPAITNEEKYQKAFVMLGRLGERKGTYDLVDAIELVKKRVPGIKCYFAGDGEVEKFRQIVKERELQENIEVVGWINTEKKIELLSKVSTVVLPSYNEGLPMAILEGMASGKAIVSTIVGAIPEVVLPENGILVEAGDKLALSDALIRCCTDLEYMKNISKNNMEKIKLKYSMKVMHSRLEKYYDRMDD